MGSFIEDGMASDTGGVKSFSLQGRLYRERERLAGMTAEERAWRAQWIKDQTLAKHEPVEVPQLRKELYNPIRRLYWIPLDTMEKALTPLMGETKANVARVFTGKLLMGLTFLYATAYYFKYNANDWTKKGGWRVTTNRTPVVPGDPGYPSLSNRTKPSDYANRGFPNSPI